MCTLGLVIPHNRVENWEKNRDSWVLGFPFCFLLKRGPQATDGLCSKMTAMGRYLKRYIHAQILKYGLKRLSTPCGFIDWVTHLWNPPDLCSPLPSPSGFMLPPFIYFKKTQVLSLQGPSLCMCLKVFGKMGCWFGWGFCMLPQCKFISSGMMLWSFHGVL